MRSRVFLKLLAAFLAVILAATVTLDFTIRSAWTHSLRQEIERGLTEKARLVASRVETDRSRPLQQLAKEEARAAAARVTIIDSSGKVLADSEAAAERMENHAGRPEFRAALRGSVGSDTRLSHTVGIEFLYVAVPVRDGAVRLDYPLSAVQHANEQVRRTLLKASVLALLAAMVLAAVAAHFIARRLRRIVEFARRVSAGELSARIQETHSDEIAQVAAALNRTARRLEESFAQLQNSRQQLEALLESMQDGVLAVSAGHIVHWTNRSLERLLGQPVRVGAPVVEVVRDPDFLRLVEETLRDRRVSNGPAASIVPGRTFEVTVAPMGEGTAVAVLRDVTERERLEKTRRDFVENVSHELRTPLSSIQGYAETLLDVAAPDNSLTREFLEIIRKNAVRMSRLAEDLLTLARVESGEEQFHFQPVRAAELLEEALQSFREMAGARGVELFPEEAPDLLVRADPDGIHHVFANLIDNAIKYGGSGTRVILGAHAVEGGVEFSVRDFGPGIPSEHVPRLFERFYRVDRARSRESGGTGLGLAIVKHIVLAHGGSVRAESELNRGSTFFFTLLQEAPEAAGVARRPP